MVFQQDGNQFTYFPQMMWLTHFEWQLHQRDTVKSGGLDMSINMSLIIGATSFIEATIKNFLLGHIELVKARHGTSPGTQDNPAVISAATQKDLLRGTWSTLNDAYLSIIKRKLTEDEAEEQAITMLVTFRNELVHGKELVAEVTEQAVSYRYRYQAIAEYLLETGVVDMQLLQQTTGAGLLSDKVANFFLGKGLAFAFTLLRNAGDAGIVMHNLLASSIFWTFKAPYLRDLITEHGYSFGFDVSDAANKPVPDATSPNMPIY